MQILLALIFGAAYGSAMHYAQPGRELRGAALAPMFGAAAGGLTWLVLTWAGVGTQSPWLWLASAAVPAALVPLTLLTLTRIRTEHDAAERARLHIA